jgi:hypothetical protein
VDWIHLAQDRVRWVALVNTIMILREFVDRPRLSASQEGLSLTQLGGWF